MDLLNDAVVQQCPYCGEPVELTVGELGPANERYEEDCSVCCRPWQVVVTRSEEGLDVVLLREDDVAR